MIRLLFLMVMGATAMDSYGQSVYTQSITNIDGAQVPLSTYQGKKVLFIIAPATLSDSAKVEDLAAFTSRYGDTIKLVGIMSVEDGYADSNKAQIKTMYQSKGVNILLTQGMYTKKSAGGQSVLMKWLTHSTGNNRYDIDAAGTGQKFFVDESGKLYAVLIAQTGLFSSAVERNIYRKL